MAVSVTIHPERLQGVVRRIARDEGLGAFMSSEAARGMDPYVPFRDGTLSKSADTSRPFHVTYSTPYANAIYRGIMKGRSITIHTDKHPKATKQWDKKWYQVKGAGFRRSIAKYIEANF